MSKLIKSTNAIVSGHGEKVIKLRMYGQREKAQDNRGSVAQSGKNVHYNERTVLEEDARKAAEEIIQDAKRQAELLENELLKQEEKIRSEAEQIFQEAEMKGWQQGYEAGQLEGRNQYEKEIRKARDLVRKAKEDYFSHLEKAEPVMLELSMGVAEKIIGETLEKSGEAWIYLIKEAVKEVRSHEEITIFIHPEKYENVLHHKDELQQIALHTRELYIYPEAGIGENDCVIETPYGRVDAGVDSQLKEIKMTLQEKLKEGSGQ
ncbi:flagellar assembly protein FliH [Evansella sp. LMS18]|uniref:flagellar assembly protein FliH n=1 Tax=Evansella sp. LMS18 TaxID=2924033 RepID=UPI0020D07519|nr:flagellar assembly protein FliH [Evansella sp. LMS18]UTR10868.1 flagellar assembly protein FliH [Evansella sp. LMS18]